MPYYWNIAPNADFTFEPTEYTRRGIDLGGDLRFLTERQHGELDWNYLPYDSSFGASRSRVRLLDVAELPDDVRLTVNAENVSDTEYFEDFSKGPEGASTAFLNRSAALAYRDEHWRVEAAGAGVPDHRHRQPRRIAAPLRAPAAHCWWMRTMASAPAIGAALRVRLRGGRLPPLHRGPGQQRLARGR